MSQLNDTNLWTENIAQPCSVQGFNLELQKLFGVEMCSQRQWLRIRWMPSEEVNEDGQPDLCDWNCFGDGGRGMWRRRYLWSSDVSYLRAFDAARGIWYAHEVWHDVSPPRFVIERLIAPREACEGWIAAGVDSMGDPFTDIKPLKGRYEALIMPYPLPKILERIGSGMIADHDDFCCDLAKAEQSQCYGQYAVPSEAHLAEFRMLAYLLNQRPERRPGFATSSEMADARKRATERNEQAWEDIGQRIGQIALEAMRTHKSRFSDDEGVRRNGKYHFLSAHNRSGLKEEPKIILATS